MAKYLILIFGDEAAAPAAGEEAFNELLTAHMAFTGRIAELGGKSLGGEALQPTQTATTIRDGVVTDGPFIETKEALGGYYVVEAPDLDTALAIAKECPAPAGGVEVRPVWEFDVPA